MARIWTFIQGRLNPNMRVLRTVFGGHARRPALRRHVAPECTNTSAAEAGCPSRHAVLDAFSDGAALLDSGLRVQFINRTLRRWIGTEARPGEPPPSLEELVRALCASAGALPEQLARQVADCIAHALDGGDEPLEFCLPDGEILQQRSSKLPHGDRIVIFRNVSELVRQRQEIEGLRAALSEVEHGMVLLDDKLCVRFINRAFRRMADLLDEFADSRPSYVEILEHGRRTNAFDLQPAEVDRYIRDRLRMVREGHTTPVEIRWSGGRVVRARIAVLPDGGRLLIYVDSTEDVAAPELAPH
jgi:PAS domain-containing protein